MVQRNMPQRAAAVSGLRSVSTVERVQPRAAMPSDERAFKVLKSSHAPTQLSLFPTRMLGSR